jgi:hypothetical protein
MNRSKKVSQTEFFFVALLEYFGDFANKKGPVKKPSQFHFVIITAVSTEQ